LRLRWLLKLSKDKSLGINEIPADLIKAGSRKFRSEIHKLRSGRSRSLHLFIRRVIKTDCSNSRGITHLSTTYQALSNILLLRLTQHAEETIGYHQCGFQRNRSTTGHIIFICQILETKMGIQ
jgi:hypothetical protein